MEEESNVYVPNQDARDVADRQALEATQRQEAEVNAAAQEANRQTEASRLRTLVLMALASMLVTSLLN